MKGSNLPEEREAIDGARADLGAAAFALGAAALDPSLTDDVLASQLLDRLTDMQAQTDSSHAPGTYSSAWGNDIKAQNPNTGVSVGEACRHFAGWLGHHPHISGEVFRADKAALCKWMQLHG